MKLQHTNLLKSLIKGTFIIAVALISSCGGTGNPSQHDDTATSSTARTKAPKTDIHTAVITENEEALKQHIAAGSDINEKDPFGGSSPLISAAVFGKPEMANILIEAGADLDFQNNDGSTALISAAFFGRVEIVRLLLDAGADKTIKNKSGATAYESVLAPFSEVKNTYDVMGKALEPLGLKLDYALLERARPEIAAMLK